MWKSDGKEEKEIYDSLEENIEYKVLSMINDDASWDQILNFVEDI